MATQNRSLPSAASAKAATDRTILDIYDLPYQVQAFEPDIGGVSGSGGTDGQLWTADGADGATWETSNAAGIGFDTLSNVLLVDPGFDSDTPGWGVTAFANLKTAFAVGGDDNDKKVVVCAPGNYASGGAIVVDETTPLYLHLMGTEVEGVRFSIDDAGLILSGSGDINGKFTLTNGAAVRGERAQINYDYYATAWEDANFIVDTTSYVSLRYSNLRANNTNNPNVIYGAGEVNYCTLQGVRIRGDISSDDAGGSVIDISHSYIEPISSSPFYQVAVDPLNDSNIVDGTTYREVVAVASLPAAAAGNAGAMAATSDGGTGSIPALMYSNGTAWVVAAE